MAEAKVGIFLHHRQVIACVVGGGPCLAALHLVKDLVHDPALKDGLLLREQVGTVFQLVKILGVHAIAEQRLGDGECVTGIVEHQQFSGVFAVPEAAPAFGVLVRDIVPIVDQTDRAPCVRDGVQVLRVIGLITERLVDVGVVRDVREIERLEHILLDELCNHIVGGDDDVVAGAAGLELGVHGLVGVEGQIIDVDACRLLKGGDHVQRIVRAVGDILAPVVDCDLFTGGGDRLRQQGRDQHECQQERKDSLFHARALLPA